MAVRFRRYHKQCRGIACNGKRSRLCPEGVLSQCGAWAIDFRHPDGRWVSKVYPDIKTKTEAEHFLSIIKTDILRNKFNLPCKKAISTKKNQAGETMKINGHKFIAEDFLEYIEPERLKDLALKGFVPCLIHESGYPVFKKKEVIDWIGKNLYVYSRGKQLTPIVKIYPHEDKPCIDGIPEEISGISELKECLFQIISSCVYFLCDGKQILYIGQSKNLYSRLSQHVEDGKRFKRVLYFYVQPNELDSVEYKLIKALRPPLNIQGK